MFGLLFQLGKWLVEAAITYAASEQGGVELTAILDEAEKDGIDVPFYEPSEGGQGESGDVGDVGVDEFAQSSKPVRKSRERYVSPSQQEG